MPGRTFVFLLDFISLMILDIYGLPPKQDLRQLVCVNGGNPAGVCSPEVENCPAGHFCSSGICCPLDMGMQKPLPLCANGVIPTGRCLHNVANQCNKGLFCYDVPGERTGICCPSRIAQTPIGSCPVNNNIGPCVVLPGHCTSDDECQQGKRCCPDGCGSVCKYVESGGYIRGRI